MNKIWINNVIICFVILISSMHLIDTSHAITVDEMNRYISKNICPSDTSKVDILNGTAFCAVERKNMDSKNGDAEELYRAWRRCERQVDDTNKVIYAYNALMNECDARAQKRKNSGSQLPQRRMESSNQTSTPRNRPNELTFNITSNHKYVVQVSLYSKNRDAEWPGGGKAYTLSDSAQHSYTIACQPGEKICFGAWDKSRSSVHWGNGSDGTKGCNNCCAICGSGSKTTSLNDASALVDNQDDGEGASNFLSGLASGLNTIRGSNQTRTTPVRPEAPRQYRSSAPCRGPGTCSSQ